KRDVAKHEVEGSGMEIGVEGKTPKGRHDRHMKGERKADESTEEIKRGKGETEKGKVEAGNKTHTASARQAEENQLSDTNEKELAAEPFKPTDFSLPKLSGQRASFSLREHGKLAQFKWLGIYDQCTKKAYQLHEISGSEIPDLESVAAFVGVAANVSSDSVQIVNCNTIVVQNFHFIKDSKRPK
ncbi:hypothetical protein PFISCL1PPCAC_27915, partial [Pristionchus fissidentatus]